MIVCACGATYKTRSTRQNLKLGIYAAYHPFFTGEQKFLVRNGEIPQAGRMRECLFDGGSGVEVRVFLSSREEDSLVLDGFVDGEAEFAGDFVCGEGVCFVDPV